MPLIDVDSTERIPCAGRWELSDLVADVSLDEAQLPDSVTLVRAPKVVCDAPPSTRPAPRGPSWRPERRSQLPAAPECPTLRQEIPRELLRMLRTTSQRREDERAAHAPTELHDTDECPTADLSDVDDLEWLDD